MVTLISIYFCCYKKITPFWCNQVFFAGESIITVIYYLGCSLKQNHCFGFRLTNLIKSLWIKSEKLFAIPSTFFSCFALIWFWYLMVIFSLCARKPVFLSFCKYFSPASWNIEFAYKNILHPHFFRGMLGVLNDDEHFKASHVFMSMSCVHTNVFSSSPFPK